MSTRIHPKNVHEKSPKSVHEKSTFGNVHEKSPIVKKSVHEMPLSTKCLHPLSAAYGNESLFSHVKFFLGVYTFTIKICQKLLLKTQVHDEIHQLLFFSWKFWFWDTLFKTQAFSWQNNMSTTRLMSTPKPILKKFWSKKMCFPFKKKTVRVSFKVN